MNGTPTVRIVDRLGDTVVVVCPHCHRRHFHRLHGDEQLPATRSAHCVPSLRAYRIDNEETQQ